MANGRKQQRVQVLSDSSDSDNDQDVQIVDAPGAQPQPAAGAAAPAAAPATSDKERRKAAFIEAWDADTKSPEEVLAAQQKSWKTSVYTHFKPPEIVHVNGEIKYKFICKKHP
ncbi:hypothetical protein EIP86_009074 [Pleurotus ostreatoroseus]|nr:hypothetical protein EIP86_009074 [Pleurotus ostreatoroseus]